MTQIRSALVLLVLCGWLGGCDDRPPTKHRSLSDAAAQLRSNATVDTTWRGHLNWNGSARILKDSDCYLLDRDYVLVGLGDGVTLRLVYRAAESGVVGSINWEAPVLVEMQFDARGSDGAYYRAAPPFSAETEISTNDNLTFGQARLKAINDAASRANPEGVVAEFEFRCS